jgi:hypothetical protein
MLRHDKPVKNKHLKVAQVSKATSNLKAYLSMPERLQHLVEQSLLFMRNHPEHMLNFGYRYAIYAAMGSEYPSRPKTDIIGHKRRAYLNILTAQYGLPAWDASLARNESWKSWTGFPQDFLEASQDILFQGISIASKKWLDEKRSPHIRLASAHPRFVISSEEDRWGPNCSIHLLDACPSTVDKEDSYVLGGIGTCAIKALDITLFDDEYLYQETDLSITEDITDYYGWDSAYYMMCAVSFWHSDYSDKHKRKAFWEWWLLDAIPHAYSRF